VSIAPTAEPFHADAAPTGPDGLRVGVLLLHGFTGSPASMVPWGRRLAERGYAVSVPRLPGHGTTWRDLNRTTFTDWHAEAERSLEKLQANCDRVVVGGLSMGGALALRLAADHGRDVAGLVLVNPAVNIDRWDVKLLPVLRHVVPSFPGITDDIAKEGVTEYGYDRTPLHAAHSMLRGFKALRTDLPQVTQPLLLLRSKVDNVVDPSSARIITSRVSSRDLVEVTLEDSYHVATLDHDADRIEELSAEFIERVTVT
jgi:carboxylesterase